MQECKSEGDRLAWLVEQHIRPLYQAAVALLEPLMAAGKVRDIPTAHLYYLLTGRRRPSSCWRPSAGS